MIFASLQFCYARAERSMSKLTHLDEAGHARMVDTSDKEVTARRAVASARVLMSAETVAAVRSNATPKGDPLETARLAGIVAAKRTADLIPLCHPQSVTHAYVHTGVGDDGDDLEATVSTRAKTGVEM